MTCVHKGLEEKNMSQSYKKDDNFFWSMISVNQKAPLNIQHPGYLLCVTNAVVTLNFWSDCEGLTFS